MKDSKLYRFLFNFPLGLAVGSIVAFLLAAALEPSLETNTAKFYVYIFSFIGSLVAATLAVTGVLYNVASQNQRQSFERQKKLISARALLPAALNDLMDISEHALTWTKGASNITHPAEIYGEHLDDLSIPLNVSETMRLVIEYTDDEKVAKRLAGIITEHQVFRSRLLGTVRASIAGNLDFPDLAERAAEWAAWSSLVATTFPYSRNTAETISTKVTQEMVIAIVAGHTPEQNFQRRLRDFSALYARSFDRKNY